MKRFLIDNDVIIDHLRGEEKARSYLRQIKSEHSDVLYSVITKAELYFNCLLSKKCRGHIGYA